MIDFDAYRAAYDSMSWADHAAFYEHVAALYPDQSQHSREHLDAFFARLGGRLAVLEVGGWRGEAAAYILERHRNVRRWLNVEICRWATQSPVPSDPRYTGWTPERWPWEIALDEVYGVGVLSHVIEHMKANHLASLVRWFRASGVEHVYVEAPLKAHKPRAWGGSQSTHVLELAWPDVIDLFGTVGYTVRAWNQYEAAGRPTRHVLHLAS